jgi:prephenate dehydrogenase
LALAAVVEVARQAAGVMKAHSVLTDVASTKAAIVDELDRVVPTHVHYVGGHPMAGSEGRGAARADPALFVGRPFVLTPTVRTDGRALAMMMELVERIGMRPVVLAPLEHDALIAQVSHLPYLVAVAVVNAASEEALSVGGPTLGAFARIASSPVELWAQIAQENRVAIADALEKARSELDALERMLSDGPALRARLARASQRSQTVGS